MLGDQLGEIIPTLVILARMLLAVALGAAIGLERELKQRPAGLRTHMLVSLAAAVFTLSEVSSRVDLSGHRAIIFVDGKAANDGATAAVLPNLEIRVADLAGGITRYRLGTSSRNLEPGERFAFSSRLDAPKDGVKCVAVSFAE